MNEKTAKRLAADLRATASAVNKKRTDSRIEVKQTGKSDIEILITTKQTGLFTDLDILTKVIHATNQIAYEREDMTRALFWMRVLNATQVRISIY